MTYREVVGRKIFLCGTEKRCRDIEEFFCEMRIVRRMYFGNGKEIPDREQEEELREYFAQRQEEDLLVISEEYSEFLFSVLENGGMKRREDYFWLDDLLGLTDEIETFYVDKTKAGKKIAVYGTGKLAEDLIRRNPGLPIAYFIASGSGQGGCLQTFGDGDEGRRLCGSAPGDLLSAGGEQEPCPQGRSADCECRPLYGVTEALREGGENIFLILAVPADAEVKRLFLDRGLVFGRDFHFYNPRVPKHPTSYYLKKTMYDRPAYTLPCSYSTRALSIKNHGNVMACCSALTLELGNCKFTSVEEILSGIQAQIVNLTINNRTYSFCGEMCRMFRENAYRLRDEESIAKNKRKYGSLHSIPDFNVQLGYDRSCNLACPSCRKHRITEPEEKRDIVEMIHEEVKSMCLKKPRNIRIGNGELFFSKYYKDIIFNCYENDKIVLITNGLLFHQENWGYLENRYGQIALEVSVDAVNGETYRKIRGGNFQILLRNLEFAGRLRMENKLMKFSLSFVVQAENFEEMVDFVKFGKNVHADRICFIKLNSWGHIPQEDFIKMDVYDPRNSRHGRFVEILHHPVFQEPNVHVDNINNYI